MLANVLSQDDPRNQPRESDDTDLLIVGGGPAGLSAAIRFKQLCAEKGNDRRVVVLEKAADMGAHILSGAVIQPTALDELLPNWKQNKPSPMTWVTGDSMRFLTAKSSIPIPAPPQMHNEGNFITSLNSMTKWLSEQAEGLGVEIYPGFAASEIVYNEAKTAVRGVATNDLGIDKNNKCKASFERGMEFHAGCTLFAEGCHGSLTKQLVSAFDLRKDSDPQTYGIGLKEVWEVAPDAFEAGKVVHSMGWPLDKNTYGGGWMYHFGENLVSIGLVVGLDFANPYINPYREFQRMKHHPSYASVLENGKCISYGARALNEGGFQSIPKLIFPGGCLIGDTAGFLNVPKIKGTHTSMKSGMIAAEEAFRAMEEEKQRPLILDDYEEQLKESWIWQELKQVRNMRPAFSSPLGVYGGILWSGLEAFVLRGKAPYTLHHKSTDAAATEAADKFSPIDYPKPDGKLSFDILTSVSRTNTNHEENSPIHLEVQDRQKYTSQSYPKYKGIENRFCPAGVYEFIEDESSPNGVRFQINAQNCIHCKTW